jgi:DNA invertase Pin-like site-specific DNA recombinase
LKHLIQLVSDLDEKGVGFESLQEQFDTVSNGGRLVFHIFCALADFERNLILERTKAGLEAARARGRQGGRPQKLSKNQVRTLKGMYDSRNHSIAEISRTFNISRPTVDKYLRKTL